MEREEIIELKWYEYLAMPFVIILMPCIWLIFKLKKIRLFKGKFKLHGKSMPRTYWGMSGCVHGMYYRNSETYYYGIKGLFGLEYYKEWGKDWH